MFGLTADKGRRGRLLVRAHEYQYRHGSFFSGTAYVYHLRRHCGLGRLSLGPAAFCCMPLPMVATRAKIIRANRTLATVAGADGVFMLAVDHSPIGLVPKSQVLVATGPGIVGYSVSSGVARSLDETTIIDRQFCSTR